MMEPRDRNVVRVAYLTTYYPAPTHTFIRDEIRSLQVLGCVVHRFSHHRAKVLVDPLDVQECSLTHHLSGRYMWGALAGVICTFAKRPVRTFTTFLWAIRLGRVGDRRVLSHLGHFALACALSEELVKVGDPHLHAHFSISPTDVAFLCSKLRGLSYSFTLHATYEYDDPERLNLREKISAAAFVVTISEHGRTSLLNRFPEFREKIKLVPCGLSDDWLDQHYQPIEASRRLVSVARLERQKNLDLLLRALAIVDAQGVPFELHIAGTAV